MQLSLAEAVAVCRIAWAEAHAALSRRAREVPQDARVIEQAKGVGCRLAALCGAENRPGLD